LDIAIILIITATVAIYIAFPFFLQKDDRANENFTTPDIKSEDLIVERLKTLDNQKENLYSAIRDIEFDYGLGKLSREDFEELDNKYKIDAASVLKKMDEIQKQSGARTPVDVLEQEILSYRNKSASNQTDNTEIENEITAFRSANRKIVSEIKCLQCGAGHSLGDLFCSKCGAKLNQK